MLHKEFNNGLRAYPIHQAVQAMGSTAGGRDETIFHLANHLVKSGMDIPSVEGYLIFIGRNCNPPFPENEIRQKIKSAIERADRREISLAAEVRDFVAVSFGIISVSNACQSVSNPITADLRTKVRVILNRLVKEGILERAGDKDGHFRRVVKDCDDIDFMNADDKTVDITLPFGLHKLAETMPGNIIGIAGEVNAGKTALLLNVAHDNMEKFKIHYFSSEMGAADLRKRLKGFDRPLSEWSRVKFKERADDFADVIEPGEGVINIIDFLEVYRDFYEIGGMMADIHRKLKGAVAVVAVQKNPGCDAGIGGWRGVEKPRLYLNLTTSNVCKIIKAKNWVDSKFNPNGKECRYKLYRGCQLTQVGGWNEELKK